MEMALRLVGDSPAALFALIQEFKAALDSLRVDQAACRRSAPTL